MCTVTVHRTGERLLVTMNRDEARDRAAEIPPREHRDETPWLAPSDSERGGTWIAVNDHGVVACMMNGYVSGESPLPEAKDKLQTRGAIIPWLMVRGGIIETRNAIERDFDPVQFPSFTLVLAHLGSLDTFFWRGAGELVHESYTADWSLFSSSSWRTEAVIAWRARAFAEWRAAGCPMEGPLPALHLLHPEGMRDWSPLMDRERTCTRSITQAEIMGGCSEAVMRYWRRDAVDANSAPIVSILPLSHARKLAHHG